MSKNSVTLVVVVGGEPVVIEDNLNAPLHTVIPKALHESKHVGQPPDNWELRDADGNLLDLNKKIGDFAFPPGTRIFLSLKAGVGG